MSERVDILLALKSELRGSSEAMSYLQRLTGGLTAAAVAYKALAIATDSGKLASEIKALSAEANLSTDAFQALKLSALEFNVSQETIVRGAVALRKNLEEAAKNGASPLNDRLRALNLTAAGLQALAPERQFEVIGRSIAFATDKEAAFAAAVELLGTKSAPKLIEFLKTIGLEGFDELAKKTRALMLTPEELDQLDRAGNAWQRIGEAMKVVGAQITLAGIAVARRAGSQGLMVNPGEAVSQSVLASVEARRAIREDPMHGRAFTPEAIAQANAARERELQMAAAEQKDLLASMDKTNTARKIQAQDQKVLNQVLAEGVKAQDERDDKLQREAETYRNLADPTREYRIQLEHIELMRQAQVLTDTEAAAATKAVTQAMMEQSGELGLHTKKLSELAEARQAIEGNPFLSVEAKQSQLGRIIQAENRELDRQIALLREKATLSPGESRQLDDLVKRRGANRFDPAGMSFGQQVGAGVMNFANSFGTQAQQVAGVIDNTIGRSVDAVSQGITGWMLGTTSWGDVMQQLGAGILQEIVGAVVRMGAQMLINATIGNALQTANAATAVGTATAAAAGISAAMLPAATLATIATLGEAAFAAPFEIMAAQAAALPAAFFDEGGFTTNGLNIAHPNEWVAPPWMVDHPVLGGVISGLESARTGGSAPALAGNSFGGKQDMHVWVDHRETATVDELIANPRLRAHIRHIARSDRGA
jgi:hypothetical protein